MVLALLALLGSQPNVLAQSDNFDSGALNSAWMTETFDPSLASFTFPANGSGKALRIQANPIPGAAPAAAAILYTNITYTNFYVALDIVNWTVEDQALVLLGRWTPDGLSGDSGMILNYDATQDGDNPTTDFKGGELQINTVTPGFSTHTYAAIEVTLVPGHSYRMVFQAVGTVYSGQIYDLNDLSKPLGGTVTFDDTGEFPSGYCGFLSFSRNDNSGTTDVTIDNFFSAVSDPNTAIAPAIHQSLYTDSGTGIPQVSSRTPTNLYNNFWPAASGISFTAKTYTAGQISASGTKLYLNGVDVSGSLAPFPANGSTVNFTTVPSTLAANQTYAARIELQDTTGTLKSTNIFWFDTFSDSYLKTATVKTIEVEDYNYTNGGSQLGPIAVSGLDPGTAQVNGGGIGYFDLIGTPEVDFHKGPNSPHYTIFSEYRTSDTVQITQGSTTEPGRDEAGDIQDTAAYAPPLRIQDTQRSQYVATNVWDYQVRLTTAGDWFNYTRTFPTNQYNVYLRCASRDATAATLSLVGGDTTTTNQTTALLGTFNIPNHTMRLNYAYELLSDGAGVPVVVNLGGTQTVRLTMGGNDPQDRRVVVMDYLLFVPAPVLQSSTNVNGTYSDAVGASVNIATKIFTVPITGNTTFYRIRADIAHTITSIKIVGSNVALTYF